MREKKRFINEGARQKYQEFLKRDVLMERGFDGGKELTHFP